MKDRRQTQTEHFIGIDAGKRTGFAVYNATDKSLSLDTLDFWSAYDRILTYDAATTCVVIEMPGTFLYTTHYNSTRRVTSKIALDVGGNRREAQLLRDRLETLGYEVRAIRPTGHNKTGGDAKRSTSHALMFKRVTGYAKRTNDHERDAGLLVYGLSR